MRTLAELMWKSIGYARCGWCFGRGYCVSYWPIYGKRHRCRSCGGCGYVEKSETEAQR